MVEPTTPDAGVVPERLRRAVVAFNTNEAPGTIVIDTGNTALYYVLGQGAPFVMASASARRIYLVRRADHQPQGGMPDWHPPARDDRAPALSAALHGRRPRQSLGARAMYLGTSQYRIHGTTIPRRSASSFLPAVSA